MRVRQLVEDAEFGEERLAAGALGAVGGFPAGDELLDSGGIAGGFGHEVTEYIGCSAVLKRVRVSPLKRAGKGSGRPSVTRHQCRA